MIILISNINIHTTTTTNNNNNNTDNTSNTNIHINTNTKSLLGTRRLDLRLPTVALHEGLQTVRELVALLREGAKASIALCDFMVGLVYGMFMLCVIV